MLDTLKTLCDLSGVTGDEAIVSAYIRSRVEPYADSISEDAMGNLTVFKKGKKTPSKTLMLSAHMDEVGVICVGITDSGYIKFACAGGIDRRVLLGKTVFFGGRIPGVIGCRAIHLIPKDDRNSVPKVEDMYIDIGASDKKSAEALVKLGDTASFAPEVCELGDNMLRAKAIDDRVGCAVLIKLIESELPYDCTFVFTVQEEVGCRGAAGAAFKLAPDISLVVEGTTAADIPSVSGEKRICSAGGGVVIPFMDRGTVYNRELYSLLTSLADINGIKWQTKTCIAGGTDASAIQRSRAGVKTAGIAAAIRNIHSPNSIASKSDIEGLYKLASLFVENLEEIH